MNYKNLLSSKPLRWALIAIGIVAFMCSCVVSLPIALTLWKSTGRFEPNLPAELIPTAEFLLAHPLPTPDYFSIEHIRQFEDKTNICVIAATPLSFQDMERFTVNGSVLPSWGYVHSDSLGNDIHHNPRIESCLNIPLPKGIHLIEYKPSELVPIDNYNYRWAIEIK